MTKPVNSKLLTVICRTKVTVGMAMMIFLLFGLTANVMGQASNSDFERVNIGPSGWYFTGIDFLPGENKLFACTKEAVPLKIADMKTGAITGEYPAGNWPTGSKISVSSKGKYLLLQQQGYIVPASNQRRSVNFEIIEANTGRQIRTFEKVQDVVIAADERSAISFSDGEVTTWKLPEATRSGSFRVESAGNAIELSPDGKVIVVSHSLTREDFTGDKTFDKQKKAINFTVKYKQRISFYDAHTEEKIRTIDELYDIIYNLKFSTDGKILFVLQNPDPKAQTTKKGITYINQVNALTLEPVRLGFTSQSVASPELKFSSSGNLFAINSRGTRFQEIHLYDMQEGSLLKRLELGHRLFEKSDGEKFISDSRPSFVFLPGDSSILVAMGNRLIKWNIESKQ